MIVKKTGEYGLKDIKCQQRQEPAIDQTQLLDPIKSAIYYLPI